MIEEDDDFAKLLEPLVAEAKQIRFDKEIQEREPDLDASPYEERAYVQFIRQKMDRVEHLLFAAIRLKARAQRSYKEADQAAEEAWDEESVKSRKSSVGRGSDFTGPRERYADVNLATLKQRRVAREAERVLSVASEVLECVKMCYDGLNGIRQEHLSILRTIQFESTLEREH